MEKVCVGTRRCQSCNGDGYVPDLIEKKDVVEWSVVTNPSSNLGSLLSQQMRSTLLYFERVGTPCIDDRVYISVRMSYKPIKDN